jgi:WD40 repeat protein
MCFFSFLYHPHLSNLITAAKDGSVKVWNETFSLLHVFVSHKRSVTCMALHPNGSQLLTGSADTTIRSWNLELGREVEKYISVFC